MRHFQFAVLRSALIATLLLASFQATAAAPVASRPVAAANTAILVGLRPGKSLRLDNRGVSAADSALAESVGALGIQSAAAVFHGVSGSGQLRVAGIAGPIDLRSVYRLRLPAGADVAAALAALRAQPDVVYAEMDGLAHLTTTPNDPLYAQQWSLAQIDAPAAWNSDRFRPRYRPPRPGGPTLD
jgi:hypothetical protein